MNYRMQQESGWGGTGAGAQEADPYSPAPRTPSWSSAQPRVFYQIRDLLLQATEIPLSEGAASRALNDYGMFTFRSTGRYPTWSEVRLDPRAVVELATLGAPHRHASQCVRGRNPARQSVVRQHRVEGAASCCPWRSAGEHRRV